MLKTSSLMFVLLFGLLFKLEKFNWRLIFIVAIMTISVIMMTDKPELGSSSSSSSSSSVGIFMVLMASMLSGLRWSFTQILLKKILILQIQLVQFLYLSWNVYNFVFFRFNI